MSVFLQKVTIALIFFFVVSSPLYAQKSYYEKHWSEVYQHELKGLPKSALAEVEQIYAKAKKDKNIPQTIKSLIYKTKFINRLEEDAVLLIVRNLQLEIRGSSAPLKNLLEAMLAEVYWQYYKDNRHVYLRRSKLAENVGDDFRMWDANALFLEIHKHFQNSLQDASAFQKIDLSSIKEILIQDEQNRQYRPTLFDLLSHQALDFYSTEESIITKPAQHFTINDTLYFSQFAALAITTPDTLSPLLQSLKIYKNLLFFHSANKDTVAFVNLELERYQFLIKEGRFTNSTDLHKKELRRLKSVFQNHPTSSLIDFELASILVREGGKKKKEALDICNKVIEKFPKSEGALKCKSLKETIISKSLNLTAEQYIPIDKPSRILVNYKNIDSLAFSIYRVDYEFIRDFSSHLSDSMRVIKIRNLIPERSWTVRLNNPEDFESHSTEVMIPKLQGGKFLILARLQSSELTQGDLYAYNFQQVTDIVLTEMVNNNATRYQVVDRNTGKPLQGARVHFKSHFTSNHNTIDESYVSNQDGFIEPRKQMVYSSTIEASVNYKNDSATFGDYYFSKHYEKVKEDEQYSAKTFLFTDRSIYRPGQTVYFKGILIKTKNSKSKVVPGEYVMVSLEDVNNTTVGSLRLKTNAFGSISGEFKLPSTGLTGEHTLIADEDDEDPHDFYVDLDNFESDEVSVSVEEYKRPTFEVTFQPVTETFSVNDTVKVKGSASAFSGSKVSGAKVSYHVKRNVIYPRWYSWYHPNAYSSAQEIDSDEVTTDKDGNFIIEFPAIADETISKDSKPVFHYEVTADVTDINGETRSATTIVKVGYHKLVATINAASIINRRISENKITIVTENLNEQFVAAKGTIEVYKLKAPLSPVRMRPWAAPEYQSISEETFRSNFPNDPLNENTDPKLWGKGKLMVKSPFNTALTKELLFPVSRLWELGAYVMELHTTDTTGEPVKDYFHFTVVDPSAKTVADNQLLVFELDKTAYHAGDIARLKVGSAAKDISITIDIETDHTISKTYIEHFSNNSKEILIPITERMGTGFAVYVNTTCFNSFITERKVVQITSQARQLEIETQTFKDKLQPGGKETWSFIIKGKEQEMQEAEVLASMYDASLDQFKPHEWRFEPVNRKVYYSNSRLSAYHCFGNNSFTIQNQRHPYYSIAPHYYDRLDWFGFSLKNSPYTNNQYLQRLYPDPTHSGKPSKVFMDRSKNVPQGNIHGRITDNEGQALPGVTVLVKGTTRGTTSNMDGDYSISAEKGEVLIFSFIGYSTAEAKVDHRNTIQVKMVEDVMALSEVVVVGYGTMIKQSLTGAVSTIVSPQSESDVELSFALQGRTPGVQITGMPGGNANILIRGNSTLGGSGLPLYVVDGEIVETSKIEHGDIGNITVLKHASATALYGSRGVNGAIIITTKSGQKKLDAEMAKVNTRKDFKETAFFFPHLKTNESGRIQFTFTTPESLTRWKLQLLAHTKDLTTTSKTLYSVTQKELMVTPNAPRFMRVGDEVVFSVKIANLSSKALNGKATLFLTDASKGTSVDTDFNNIVRSQTFKVNEKGTTELSWKLKIPGNCDALQYKIVAKAGNFSDGEQNALPVLSNRMLVTETMPMYVRSGQKKEFDLVKLKTTSSPTLKHHQLTLEVTSNPAWYALQSLPYLMEFPHECAEQTFARYYANTLASYVVNNDPKIKSVFEKWAGSGELISNLEKNQELKSIIIQETPWLRDAQSESEQKKRVALLFDLNKLKAQLESSATKLKEMQLSNGGFPWFSGSDYANAYITQHVATGYGHLKQLKIIGEQDPLKATLQKAVDYLDGEMVKEYDRLLEQAKKIRVKADKEKEGIELERQFLASEHVGYSDIHYLYMRSFYPEIAQHAKLAEAIKYYTHQSAKYWQSFPLYLKAMIALIHHRDKNMFIAKEILTSLKENSITSEELGMYWKENVAGWYWHEAPVETQALLIEAFAEIEAQDTKISEEEKRKTLDELRIWLLKNKQTSQWKTTKATTEAVYALLLNGTNWLPLDEQVEVSVASKKVTTETNQVEAGTGYFKTSWKGEEIKQEMGKVTLSKKADGIAWAGMYWQYFEDLDKITPAETPLKLAKKVFRVSNTDRGEVLTEVNKGATLKVVDLLRIRIELKVDRDMEFLHMKDMRASGLEPADVLSAYKWQEGLGYYQSTKDASTNFFFDRVRKGVYVFEYDLRVNNKGNFSNGITTIQSMYAPEFSSHSEGIRIEVE